MKERLDRLRRRYIAERYQSQRQQFKKLRSMFMRNLENLNEECRVVLQNMRTHFSDLADAYMLKEALRSIYLTAKDALDARVVFRRWATIAEATSQCKLIAMAKTIREKLQGIITYWTFDGLSHASTEGFHNKIRWLIRQAYGALGLEYLKFRIRHLPLVRDQKGF